MPIHARFPGRCGSTSSTTADVLRLGLKVMDATAVSLCMDNGLPIVVFDMMEKGNVVRAVRGEKIGTLVSQPGRCWVSAADRRDRHAMDRSRRD